MRSLRSLAVVATVLAASLAPAMARAQSDVDRATARRLGESGQQALDAKDYKKAEDDFRRADSLVHAPTLMLGLARALAAEGKLLEAQEAYKRIVREGAPAGSPAVFQKAVEDAGKEVDGVSSRIGSVTITVKGAAGEAIPPEAQVTWDGAAVSAATLGVPRPANPGSHQLHAACAGYSPVDATVNVPAGGSVDAPLMMKKGPSSDTSTPPPTGVGANAATATPGAPPGPEQPAAPSGGPGVWPWVAFGVAGAGLVAGGIAGALVLSKHSDLANKCSGGNCTSQYQSDVDSYNTMGLVSTIGFVVAGVGAAAGITLLVVHPKADAAPASASVHVTPVVGLGSIGAVGSF